MVTEGTTLQLQQSNIEADGVSGSVQLRYLGTRTELNALITTLGLATNGHKYAIQPTEGPFAELVWTIATGSDGSSTEVSSVISTDWDLSTPSAMVPLSEHGSWATQLAALLAGDSVLHALFLQVWTDDAVYADIGAPALATLQATYPYLYACLQMKREGVQGYYRGEPVLTVVDRYQRQAAFTLDTAVINKVYTTAQLISALQSRSAFPIPSDISSNLAPGEWLTEAITRHSSSDGSREVTQVFRHAPLWRDPPYTHA